jgi:hypothetical protein
MNCSFHGDIVLKNSRATSHVKWLSDEKNQCFKDHLCPRLQGTDVSTLKMRTGFVLETLVFSSLNDLTQLIAREFFFM